MSASEAASPETNLANLVVMLLAPMFLWSTNGDIRLAYTAAAQTVNAYRIANRLSLFTVAKIIAFDIATLSSLSLSMYEDVSMLLALRLRGNANSLDRSGERNRRVLEQASEETEEDIGAAIAKAQRLVNEARARKQAAARAAEAPPPAPAAEPPVPPAPVPPSAPADAMTKLAEAFTAEPRDLPAEQRWQQMAGIEALTKAAADFASGAAPPPVPAMAAA